MSLEKTLPPLSRRRYRIIHTSSEKHQVKTEAPSAISSPFMNKGHLQQSIILTVDKGEYLVLTNLT